LGEKLPVPLPDGKIRGKGNMMVVRQYVFLALERLQEGSKIRVTENGLSFNSLKYAKTFVTEKGICGSLSVRFNGIVYDLNTDTRELEPCGEYGPYEGMKGALWE
jgi:hypothetical protein